MFVNPPHFPYLFGLEVMFPNIQQHFPDPSPMILQADRSSPCNII